MSIVLPVAQSGGPAGILFGLVFFVVGGALLWGGIRKADMTYDFRRQSVTKISSLSDGDVAKVKGTVRKKDNLVKAPINDKDAVLYDYRFEEYDHDSGGNSGSSWETREHEVDLTDFYIEGEAGGKVLIPKTSKPDVFVTTDKRTRTKGTEGGADINIDTLGIGDVNIGGERVRHTQKAFAPGDDIIVYGTAKRVKDSGFDEADTKITEGSATEHFVAVDKKDGLPSYLQAAFIILFGLVFSIVGLGFIVDAATALL